LAPLQHTEVQLTKQLNTDWDLCLDAVTPPEKITDVKPGWVLINTAAGNQEFVPFYRIGKTGQDWYNLLQRGTNPDSLTVSSKTQSSTLSHSWASADISAKWGFFNFTGSSSWSQFNFDTCDSSFSATVSWKGSAVVEVAPDDQWFKTPYLIATSKKPAAWNPGYTTDNVIGPNSESILPGIVGRFVVVYKPSFKITFNDENTSQFAQSIKAAAGFTIGPFNFGGDGGHDQNTFKYTQNGGTFEGESTAEYPLIIAVYVSPILNSTSK